MSRTREVTAFLHGDTDKAWMISRKADVCMNRNMIFLPKSQVEEVRRQTDMGTTQITFDVPLWLIEKNDLEDLVDE